MILGCDACQILRSETDKTWCTLFVTKRVQNKRCNLRRKNGAYVPTIKDASLLKNRQGEVIGALEIYRDITELEKKDLTIMSLTNTLHEDSGFHGIVGESPSMIKTFQLIEKAGQSEANILIGGESGTGKELVAKALHETGRRKSGPFVKINCSALNESIIESELFGHCKGAFTGAHQHKKGLFEAADGGDIFLDEISEIPLHTQAKLLRVVETKQMERVGDTASIFIDVRIIAASNRNLVELSSNGVFREDLFFRLNVFSIHLPPLRERREDIPLLAFSFLREFRNRFKKNLVQISPQVMESFMRYAWPGNVRELRSVLEYASILTDSKRLEMTHLPNYYQEIALVSEDDQGHDPEADKEAAEKKTLIEALKKTGGNQTRAAKILNVNRMTVFNRMRKYGISSKKVFQINP